MKFKCPKCKRTLLDRRATKCEFCFTPLPLGVRLSDDEVALRKKMKEAEYAKHRKEMERLKEYWPGGATAAF